jgi:transcriptional regulator with XRE-family HTH domain
MIDYSKLGFLMQALGLTNTQVAEAVSITPSMVSHLTNGRHKPSFDLHQRIENLLKSTWEFRKGQTFPPEVAGIVYELLYPPAPFNPFDGPRKPGRPGKSKNESAPELPGLEPERKTEGAAALLKETHETETSGESTAAISSGSSTASGDHTGTSSRPSVHAADRQTYRHSSGAALPTASLTRWTSDDINDVTRAAQVRARLTDDTPNVRALRDSFFDAIRSEAPGWLNRSNTNDAINGILRRKVNVKLRARSKNTEKASSRAQVAAYTLRIAAQIESDGHAKGAYSYRAWMDLRATLLSIWDRPEARSKIFEIYGQEISYPTFERIFRAEFGGVSPMERAAKVWAPETIGYAPEYAGQTIQMDGTEFPVDVATAWGRARRDGDVAQIAAFIIDVGSLKTWMHVEGNTSEVYLWNPIIRKFFEQTNYAPEFFVTDEGGRGINSLRHQKPGQALTMDAAIRLLVAVGTRPHAHTPGLPRSKGTVECGAVKAGKSTLKRVLSGRFVKALLSEIKNVPPSYRWIQTEMEWREIVNEVEQSLNARTVKRIGDGTLTRAQSWDLPEFIARRAERALAPDWRDKWQSVVSQGFAMTVIGNNRLYMKGVGARAELRAPLGHTVQEGSVAILFPGGLRAGDDELGDELLRGVVIEPTQGQPVYHAIEAMKVKKSFLGFEVDRPKLNEHPVAKPQSEKQRRIRAWHESGIHAPAALKQGTTDEPISPALGGFA